MIDGGFLRVLAVDDEPVGAVDDDRRPARRHLRERGHVRVVDAALPQRRTQLELVDRELHDGGLTRRLRGDRECAHDRPGPRTTNPPAPYQTMV